MRQLAKAKLADVRQRLAELRRIETVLDRPARACRGRGPTSECPILDLLDEEAS